VADRRAAFDAARAVACPTCSVEPGQDCRDTSPRPGPLLQERFTHGARLIAGGVLPEPVADAARWIRAREASEQLWAPVLPDATRRLLHDALLRARTRSAAALIREDRRGQFAAGWTDRDQHLAEWAAAVALVIAERPELITGTPPTLRPAAEVLAGVLDPVILADGFTPLVDAHERAQVLARRLVEALEAAGYEVAPRVDRFASLADGGRQVRMPLRGTCGVCSGAVRRHLISDDAEALLGGWFHVEADVAHEPDRVEAP
jgi:hypothetical protein